ncbi:MAG: hypothetical protein GAK43_01201 [Stenotrophomonas maltophilia]|nr:MAG: hypothetical protein GAK43_01201 [Stenotrophomonas maltophilia]
MAPAARVVAHVRRTAEAGQATAGDGGGMAVAVDLQGRADEQVDRVLPGQLAEHAVGAQRAVAAGEEHVRARGDVTLYAQFGAEAVHALDPAAFDGGNQRGVRVERPVAADLAFQAEAFAVGGQDQFDGGGVEADAMVERLHVVFFVDAANRHHRHQHVYRLDVAWIAGEQRFDVEGPVGDHHEVDPRCRDVDPRQVAGVVDQLVDLDDDDAIAEGRRFDQRRAVFGARAGIDVAVAIGHEAGAEHHVGDQVDHQPRVQLDVGVDGADFQLVVFEQLADAQALGAGEGEVQLARDAVLEQVEVLGAADAGHDHVQVVDLLRIETGQRAREEVGLLLVVAFEHHAVTRLQQRLQGLDDALGGQDHAIGEVADTLQAALLVAAPACPLGISGG